jgi:hypothetical protein
MTMLIAAHYVFPVGLLLLVAGLAWLMHRERI